jgi:hypothetical protein
MTAEMETLLPLACEWAEQEARELLRIGQGLDASELELAAHVGVREPAKVRVAEVSVIPAPRDPQLARACVRLGFLVGDSAGLTLGYGIYLRRSARTRRPLLLAHELRHVAQYEQHPSVSSYVTAYLRQLLEHGYDSAPFEVDALAAETHGRTPDE